MGQLLFNKETAGLIVRTSSYWETKDYQHFTSGSTGNDGIYETILSGFYIDELYQTCYGQFVDNFEIIERKQIPENYNAQDLVNEIIRNNKHIYENNLLCAYASKYMSQDDKKLLYDLQERLLIRDEALRNNNLTTNLQDSYPKGYINLYNRLDAIINNKIGIVVSSTTMIVVGAVVIASVGAAAYFAYMAFAEESEDDVKFSDELTAKLVAKLTPEDLEQLYNETEGIVTKARLKEKFGTIAGFSSTLFWVLGGAALLYWWQSRSKTSRKTSKKKEK